MQGVSAAERFAEDYYAVDELNPKDYALEKRKAEPIGPEEEGIPGGIDDELNGPDFVDFSDILDRDEDSYDDIEITDEPFQ